MTPPAHHDRELAFIVAPLDEREFVRRHWDQNAVHIPGSPGKFDALYSAADWSRLPPEAAIDAAFVDDEGQQTQTAIDPTQVELLYRAGLTICADVSTAPPLASFLAGFRNRFCIAGNAFAKLYASPDACGFALHADSFHVFVLQLAGQKRWTFSPTPALSAPLQSFKVGRDGHAVYSQSADQEIVRQDNGAPLEAPALDKLPTVTLNPGDCLYLPPGTWHRAQAVGESVALSVSPPRSPGYRVVLQALEAELRQEADWRKDLTGFVPEPVTSASGVGVPEPVAEAVMARVGELRRRVRDWDVRSIHRLWRAEIEKSRAQRSEWVADDGTPSPARVERHERLARRGTEPIPYLVAPGPTGDEMVFFFHQGAEYSLPAEGLTFVRRLASAPPFRAEEVLDWDPRLTWPEARDVLAQLLRTGVLRRS